MKNPIEKGKRLLWLPPGFFHQTLHASGSCGKNEQRDQPKEWTMEKFSYRWGAGLCETGKMGRYTTDKGDIVIQKSTLSDTL